MPKRQPIGMFPEGMDNRSKETSMPKERARQIKNYHINKDGTLIRRKPINQILPTPNIHSLYSSLSHNILFGCIGSTLGVFDLVNDSFTVKAQMPKILRTDYVDLNGITYATNSSFSCRFFSEQADLFDFNIDPELANINIVANNNGGLEKGSYGVAYSLINTLGEESPLSTEFNVSIPQGGGIAVNVLSTDPNYILRIYSTQPNSEEYYLVWEAQLTATTIAIDKSMLQRGGMQPKTRHLSVLPKGHFITAIGPRLVVANNDVFYYSSAFHPTLTDLRHNFVCMQNTILLLKAVDNGLYVGDITGMYFFAGRDPDTWEMRQVSNLPPVYGTGLQVAGKHFEERFHNQDKVVTWLSTDGLSIGDENGNVITMHPEQLDIPYYSSGISAFVNYNGIKQIVTPVASNSWLGTGTAIDSQIH